MPKILKLAHIELDIRISITAIILQRNPMLFRKPTILAFWTFSIVALAWKARFFEFFVPRPAAVLVEFFTEATSAVDCALEGLETHHAEEYHDEEHEDGNV